MVGLGEVISVGFSIVRGGTIAGTISDEGSGLPLREVDVSLYDSSGHFVGSDSTGSDGLFEFDGLDLGAFYLRAR